jgi:hypothetical protein
MRQRTSFAPVAALVLTVSLAATTAVTVRAAAPAAATPVSLLVPQGTAFAALGHSCGGIQEQAFATGFDATSGRPTGAVYVQTRCGGSGVGGGYHVTTYRAWLGVTWDFTSTVVSSSKLTTPPAVNPTLSAVDAAGDRLQNTVTAVNVIPAACSVGNTTYCTYRAWLTVVPPGRPGFVQVKQANDQLSVAWWPLTSTAKLVSSSTVTATPVASSVPTLTATVMGTAARALVGPVQPGTTYSVTVVSKDAGGTSPTSNPVTFKTQAATVVPTAPTGVSASWTSPGSAGDQIAVRWSAPTGGNSPVDSYQVQATFVDGDLPHAPVTQTVTAPATSGALTANDVDTWSVQVRAHNGAGWGPWSNAVVVAGQ